MDGGLAVHEPPGSLRFTKPPDRARTLSRGAREKSFETYARDNGSEVVCLPPAEFKAYVASEIERYRRVLPPLGIQVD